MIEVKFLLSVTCCGGNISELVSGYLVLSTYLVSQRQTVISLSLRVANVLVESAANESCRFARLQIEVVEDHLEHL